jgi:TIR domain
MKDTILQIIEKKIKYFLEPSLNDLSLKTNGLLKGLKHDDSRKVSSIANSLFPIVGEYIALEFETVLNEIKRIVKVSGKGCSSELAASVYKLIETNITEERYIKRYSSFVGSIIRHFSRMGIRIDKNKFRYDLSLTKFQVMVKNLIRRKLKDSKAELELLSISTQNSQQQNNGDPIMSVVFISYSHVDLKVADEIAAILDEYEIKYFRDVKDIEWGAPISAKVKEGIEDSIAILVIISPASLKSHWVPYEIGYATAKGKRILPYLEHPSLDVPSYIRDLNHKSDIAQVKTFFAEFSPKNLSLSGYQRSKDEKKLDELKKIMPELLTEIKSDIEGDDSQVVREFVLLPNDRVIFNSKKKRFIYFEDTHSDLQNKIDLLEDDGFVEDVSPSETPVYRFSELFINLLRGKEFST